MKRFIAILSVILLALTAAAQDTVAVLKSALS